jgi:dTDP-4-amino-4,6-dideoxygalactose transaminase
LERRELVGEQITMRSTALTLAGRVIPVAKPLLGEAEAAAASRAILSGWVTQGPEVAAFEREFAAFTGAPHACAVSNCTTALHLALEACGVGRGDEVITTSHSFIATANAIRYCGAIPVFVDIDAATFNIDPAPLWRAVSPRTKAILCVHQLGMPCDLRRILEVARAHKLRVVEDAACAIGSETLWNGAWERIGRPHADVACFSFHPRKLVTTGDGGMLTTASAEMDQRFRLLRQHSMSVPDTVRHGARDVVFEEYPILGYNYRMTDIQAAVGREQLKRLPSLLERRRALAARYAELLRDVPAVTAPKEPAWARSNWQSYAVRLPRGCEQRPVMQAMLDAGVSTRRGVMCAHLEAAYEREPWHSAPDHMPDTDLRHSEEATRRTIILPLFAQMTDDEQDQVVWALARAVALECAPAPEAAP